MSRTHIGQVLSRMGRLTQHDINDILADQRITRRPFGQIALAWGLCEPEHIWQAWWRQLSEESAAVDLEAVGIDAQATARLDAEVAWRLEAVPVRLLDEQLVVAIRSDAPPETAEELRQLCGRQTHFVSADREQIRRAIATYYPRPAAVATAASDAK